MITSRSSFYQIRATIVGGSPIVCESPFARRFRRKYQTEVENKAAAIIHPNVRGLNQAWTGDVQRQKLLYAQMTMNNVTSAQAICNSSRTCTLPYRLI